jgi:hypothetical protein
LTSVCTWSRFDSISFAVAPGSSLALLPPPQEANATAPAAPRRRASISELKRPMVRV